MDDVASVYHDLNFLVAIKKDGSLWAWGNNSNGLLGDGTREYKTIPVKIMDDVVSFNMYSIGFSNVEQKITSSHMVAIKKDRSLWAWGENEYGQLGDGTREYRLTPVKVMENVSTVYIDDYLTMAIKLDNSLWAWGRNGRSQLGDGTKEDRHSPVKIMDNVDSIYAAGRDGNTDLRIMALQIDGSLWAWGRNGGTYVGDDGRLGDGTKEDREYPVKIMDGVTAVYPIDTNNTLVIKNDGSVWGWGLNKNGELGDGTTTSKNAPVKISFTPQHHTPIKSNKSPGSIVGKWEDRNELIEFKKDGTFSASYYWLGGEYYLDGNELTLSAAMLGKEQYLFDIDGDTLYLYTEDGHVAHTFTKFKQ